MAKQVCQNAVLTCSFGAAPSMLGVIPMGPPVMTEGNLAATIMDHKPIVNIKPFGLCSAPTNPVVIAATAAKLGVFTPAPCVPLTPAPWTPGSPTIAINGNVALNDSSTCMCMWAGVISVSYAGQATVNIP